MPLVYGYMGGNDTGIYIFNGMELERRGLGRLTYAPGGALVNMVADINFGWLCSSRNCGAGEVELDSKHIPIKPKLESSILIYDGECGFCNTSLLWAYRNLSNMPAAEPYQSAPLSKLNLSLEEVENAVYLIDTGVKKSGHEAIAQLFLWQEEKTLPRLLGRILAYKRLHSVWAFGYRWVAKNRRLFPGATEACGSRPKQEKDINLL